MYREVVAKAIPATMAPRLEIWAISATSENTRDIYRLFNEGALDKKC